MFRVTRRDFLKVSILAGAGASATRPAFSADAISQGNVLGANNDIRVAVVGFRSQGRGHIEGLRKLPSVRTSS